jgi:hypothetical protein
MVGGTWLSRVAIAGGSALAVGTLIFAQSAGGPSGPTGRAGRDQLPRPVYRVAQQPGDRPAAQPGDEATARVAANNNSNLPVAAVPPAQNQHPLVPALQMANSSMNTLLTIKDYSATMIKRERISGKLNEPEYMYLKVRHQPFSVYMFFLGPPAIRGQEAMYVEGKNNGNLLGHGVGIKKIAGTVSLQPTGAMAMAGQRYPITEIGILNLTKRLIEVGEADKQYGECDVKFFKEAKINNRLCTCIQVLHPVPRKNFKFNVARVFVDDQLNIPVRYESYDWPEKQGGQPQLIEEYTYTDIKINNGFTDADFDENNSQYHFH